MSKKLQHETHVLLLALAACLPPWVGMAMLLWSGEFKPETRWTLLLFTLVWIALALTALRHRVRFPLQTLANLVSAIREGDFSIRARGGRASDSMGELSAELNALASRLREQRFDSMEASALVRTVMAEIDAAVFAFDGSGRLRLVNRAGERVLGRPAEQLMARFASELGLSECLEGQPSRTLHRAFPGGGERWSLRRGSFRQGGIQHQLVVLTDLSRALREEERQAWQRLLRVLGHELNNSLAPIKSIAGSMERLMATQPRPADWEDDFKSGLSVIASRTAALGRFMEGYTRLAKLPPPRMSAVETEPFLHRVAALERRVPLRVRASGNPVLLADPDQLEQLLINLIRNAADAVLIQPPATGPGGPAAPGVDLACSVTGGFAEIRIIDEGPGISNPSNLFVPFFTTKPGGSGVGLVLSRQIAEAHGGSLELKNRTDGPGCIATLRLPLPPPDSPPPTRPTGGTT